MNDHPAHHPIEYLTRRQIAELFHVTPKPSVSRPSAAISPRSAATTTALAIQPRRSWNWPAAATSPSRTHLLPATITMTSMPTATHPHPTGLPSKHWPHR